MGVFSVEVLLSQKTLACVELTKTNQVREVAKTCMENRSSSTDARIHMPAIQNQE